MSDDVDAYVSDLIQNEGCIVWPYLDSRQAGGRPDPVLTFGIGNAVKNVLDFGMYPWVDMRTGYVVETSGVKYAWEDLFLFGQTIPARTAKAFEHKTTLRLPVDYCRQLCRDRLTREFLPRLTAAFSDDGSGGAHWWDLPLDARRVCVDCAWTTGAAGFAKEWPKLIAACKAGEWMAAADNSHSSGMGTYRSEWRQTLLRRLA